MHGDELLLAWQALATRCGPLWRLLHDCRLGLTAGQAAITLGLKDPAELRKWLQSGRLPPFAYLRNWGYVVFLLERPQGSASLAGMVLDRGEDPSMYYRFVKRVTGMPWRNVKAHGRLWAIATALQVWGPHVAPVQKGYCGSRVAC
jgi:hypothetical protein